MLVGPVARADKRVQVVDADHIHVAVVLERVALDADHAAQPFFVEQVPGEQHAALLAPLVDLAVVGVAIELGERRVKIIAHARAIGADIEEQIRQARAQVVAVAVLKAPEHILGPRHDRVVAARDIVVHGRLVGVEANDRRWELGVGSW